jgi:hypothetical protein
MKACIRECDEGLEPEAEDSNPLLSDRSCCRVPTLYDHS